MNWSLSTASKLEVDEHLNRKREQSHGKQKLLRYIESLRDTSFGESRIQFQLIRNSMSSECWWQLYKSWKIRSIIGHWAVSHFCPTKVESNKKPGDFASKQHFYCKNIQSSLCEALASTTFWRRRGAAEMMFDQSLERKKHFRFALIL